MIDYRVAGKARFHKVFHYPAETWADVANSAEWCRLSTATRAHKREPDAAPARLPWLRRSWGLVDRLFDGVMKRSQPKAKSPAALSQSAQR